MMAWWPPLQLRSCPLSLQPGRLSEQKLRYNQPQQPPPNQPSPELCAWSEQYATTLCPSSAGRPCMARALAASSATSVASLAVD